ncbi:phosphoenolpyruvate carboxykinase [Tanacetum coccineum]
MQDISCCYIAISDLCRGFVRLVDARKLIWTELLQALEEETRLSHLLYFGMCNAYLLESVFQIVLGQIGPLREQQLRAIWNKFRVIDYVNSRTCGDKTVSQNIGAIVELKLLSMEYAKEKVPLMNQENTLAAYPIDYITNAKIPSVGPYLKNVNLLACDALCWLKDCHLTFVVLKLFLKWLFMNVIKVMAMIREVDFLDKYVAKNTLAAYPIDYITNAKIPSVGPHLKNVNLLACDALYWLKDCHLTFVVLKLFQKWLGYGGQFWFFMNVVLIVFS